MQKWEYKKATISTGDISTGYRNQTEEEMGDDMESLNRLAADGWEVMSVFPLVPGTQNPRTTFMMALMKRPFKDRHEREDGSIFGDFETADRPVGFLKRWRRGSPRA